MNFGCLLVKNEPLEFSIKDKPFFDRYKNKEVVVIKDYPSEGYFILEDNNYLISDYCFDEVKKVRW